MADGQLIASGSFVSTGAAKDIVLRSDFDSFEVLNATVAAAAGGDTGARFYWQKGMPSNATFKAGFIQAKTTTTNALTLAPLVGSEFLRVDEGDQSVGVAKALSGTEITNANPAVATSTAHGYSVGDRVIFSGTTAMLQIAGIPFELTAVAANSMTMGFLDASGFAAAATAGSVRRLPRRPLFQPEKLYITNITQAAQMVVTYSFAHGLVVGAKSSFSVASANGMIQLNNLVGTVVAISTVNNTATYDIDSSAFTAWAWPVSGTVFTPAHSVPSGEANSILTMAEVNSGRILMRLGAGTLAPAGVTSDVIYWRAFKSGYSDNI